MVLSTQRSNALRVQFQPKLLLINKLNFWNLTLTETLSLSLSICIGNFYTLTFKAQNMFPRVVCTILSHKSLAHYWYETLTKLLVTLSKSGKIKSGRTWNCEKMINWKKMKVANPSVPLRQMFLRNMQTLLERPVLSLVKQLKVTEHSCPIFGVPILYFAILATVGLRLLEKKVNETQVSKTVISHLKSTLGTDGVRG